LEQVRERLIHIHRCRGVSRRTIQKFLQDDPSLQTVYRLTPAQVSQLYRLPMKYASQFCHDLHQDHLRTKLLEDLSHYQIITIVDESYPVMLKRIKDPPLVLYLKGNQSLLHHIPALSIIGTRNPSTEALKKTALFVKPLVKNNWVIVSGMAQGVDRFAHLLSLQYGGKTIAVLGSGFKHIYPKQNRSLFYHIAKKGLLISEYPPDQPALRHHFPERNRIISGLSMGTLVIEATERSGTLITVDQALDQGREVYAVPGSPLIPQTKGCHQLIQDGAKLAMNATDILEDWEGIQIHS